MCNGDGRVFLVVVLAEIVLQFVMYVVRRVFADSRNRFNHVFLFCLFYDNLESDW